jgi:ABC-type multidrug transport system ATPase subunit
VDEVMELVELNGLKDAIVGLPGVNGLSTEQRKRLTIAVELVANPSIIFMDEPTSGLDARAAAIVMRTVRNTVNTGRTVVCTIHQPSIDIFEAFDEVMPLQLVETLFFLCMYVHFLCFNLCLSPCSCF